MEKPDTPPHRGFDPAAAVLPGSVARTLNTGEGTIDMRASAQRDAVMQLHSTRIHRTRNAGKPEQSAVQPGAPPPVRGWLLVYMAVLAYLGLHGAALTTGAIGVYAHPAAGGPHSPFPLGSLLFYVATNLILILYTIVLFVLISLRRRSAIVNNVIFNVSSVVFLVVWHILGEKSDVGVLVDSAPNLAGVAYILLSKRVRSTFIVSRPVKGYR